MQFRRRQTGAAVPRPPAPPGGRGPCDVSRAREHLEVELHFIRVTSSFTEQSHSVPGLGKCEVQLKQKSVRKEAQVGAEQLDLPHPGVLGLLSPPIGRMLWEPGKGVAQPTRLWQGDDSLCY